MENKLTEILYHGESTKVLRGLEDNSIDSVVCDPPYGLSKEPDIAKVLSEWVSGDDSFVPDGKGFMSKEWDGFVPPPSLWKEVYRVLKPGGHALVFVGTRTQDLMTISLRLAGFEVRDVIEWLYFSGFPKSHDVSKAFDKRNGRNYPDDDFREYLKERAKSAGLTGAQVDRELGTNGMWGHYVGRSQPAFPTVDAWERLKTLLNLDDRYDEIIHRSEAEREKIGRAKGAQAESTGRYGAWGNDGGKGISEYDITTPATNLARKWDGWGTSLKPAHEPIIVVRKPLIDADTGRKLTVADCVEKYGTGAINIDATRIATEDETRRAKGGWQDGGYVGGAYDSEKYDAFKARENNGRFPANCITLDSDEFYSKYFNVTPAELSKKASKKDRNSDWLGEQLDGINVHPTVKPIDLMAWLVRLVTPPRGTVLDPFAGSGSTLVAAKREGFSFIGIEREAEYVEICEARTEVAAI